MQDEVQSQPVSRSVCEHAMPAAKKRGRRGLASLSRQRTTPPRPPPPSSLSLSPPRSPTLSPPPAAATPLSGNNDGLKFLNILRGGEEKREEEGKTSFLRPAAGGRHEGQKPASRRVSEWRKGKEGTSVPRFLFLNLDHVPDFTWCLPDCTTL